MKLRVSSESTANCCTETGGAGGEENAWKPQPPCGRAAVANRAWLMSSSAYMFCATSLKFWRTLPVRSEEPRRRGGGGKGEAVSGDEKASRAAHSGTQEGINDGGFRGVVVAGAGRAPKSCQCRSSKRRNLSSVR